MSDIDELPRVLEPLLAFGVRIAIDDFGTGSSVLRRLQHCRIETLKIDRSFLSGITRSWHEVPLIKALLSMARGLDLTVVAEGVETEVQADLRWEEHTSELPSLMRISYAAFCLKKKIT